MNETGQEIGRKMFSGFAWIMALRVFMRLSGLLNVVILARLLVPEDFGLVALATFLMAAVDLLTEFNFKIWLIRHKDPRRQHYDTVWTLTILRGAVTCLVLVLIASWAAEFFEEPRLFLVVLVLAAASLIGAFVNIGVVDFQRELAFRREVIMLGLVKIGSLVVGVGAAVILQNYWALVWALLSREILLVALSYAMHSYRPRLCLQVWREVYEYSKWLLVTSLLGFGYFRVDTLIVGKLMEGNDLGLYSVARRVADLASSQLVTPIRRVLLPGYAKLNASPEQLRQGFLDGFSIIMLGGLPCAAGIFATADPLVRVLLGEKWLAAIPIMQVLGLYAFSAVAMSNQGPILMVLGRTRLLAGLYGFSLALLLPSFYFGVSAYGLTGGAAALGVTNMVAFAVTFVITPKLLKLQVPQVLLLVWRILAATAVMVAAIALLREQLFTSELWAPINLAIDIGIGVVAYVGVLWALWHLCGNCKGPERTAWLLVVETWRKRRGAGSAVAPSHSGG